MGDAGKRRSLGRGLAALLGEEDEAAAPEAPAAEASAEAAGERPARTAPIEHLRPNRLQPRRQFDEDGLAALAESIRARGLLQPILVRRDPMGEAAYEIVAGERRWRAAQLAQLHDVPIVLRDLDDRETLEVAIVENVQRQDLSPLEEAEGYRRLIEEFRHTQDELAGIVGKSRSHIANTLRLLQLPDAVKALVQSGRLSAGHARALLGAEDADGVARQVAEHGLSVRETEKLARQVRKAAGRGGGRPGRAEKDADTRALESDLAGRLGLEVSIDARGEAGTLTIRFRTLEQLDGVVERLTRAPEERQ